MPVTISGGLALGEIAAAAKDLKELIYSRSGASRDRRQRMLALYGSFISKGDLCFDVGANLGNRTDIFLGLGASVIAVEPQSVCLRRLAKKYRREPRVTIVPLALGSAGGQGQLRISRAHTISSMSDEWIASVRRTGRFSRIGKESWSRTTSVPMATLDQLIEQYGRPMFCKIDVEGYEAQVLRGLNQPLSALSFEFTPEFMSGTIDSLGRLSELGNYEFNYSLGESMTLKLPGWFERRQLELSLANITDPTMWGDVYARLRSTDRQ